jgi:hypothetical protein
MIVLMFGREAVSESARLHDNGATPEKWESDTQGDVVKRETQASLVYLSRIRLVGDAIYSRENGGC